MNDMQGIAYIEECIKLVRAGQSDAAYELALTGLETIKQAEPLVLQDVVSAQSMLANLYAMRGQAEDCLRLRAENVALIDGHPDATPKLLCSALRQHVEDIERFNYDANTNEQHLRIFTLLQKHGLTDDLDYALELKHQARQHIEQKDLDVAEDYLLQTLSIFATDIKTYDFEYKSQMNDLCEFYRFEREDVSPMFDIYRNAQILYVEEFGRESREYYDVLRDHLYVHEDANDRIPLFEQLLDVQEKIGTYDFQEQTELRIDMLECLREAQQFARAESFAIDTLNIIEAGQQWALPVKRALAEIYAAQGNQAQYSAMFQKLIEEVDAHADNDLLSASEVRRAWVECCCNAGDFDDGLLAIESILAAMPEHMNAEDQSYLTEDLVRMRTQIYMHLERFEEAEQGLKQCIEQLNKNEFDAPSMRRIYYEQLASIYEQSGRDEEADRYYQLAQEASAAEGSQVDDLLDRSQQQFHENIIADLQSLQGAGDWERIVETVLGFNPMMSFPRSDEQQMEIYQFVITAYQQLGKADRAQEIQEMIDKLEQDN